MNLRLGGAWRGKARLGSARLQHAPETGQRFQARRCWARSGRAQRVGARLQHVQETARRFMSEQNETKTETKHSTPMRLPLWRACLDDMMASGASFGSAWKVDYFEGWLKEKLGTGKFSFAMLPLREALFSEHGYYLRSSESGRAWDIPSDEWHAITQAPAYAARAKESLRKQIHITSSVLANPLAQLTADVRRKAEHGLCVASLRLVLFNRSKSVGDYVKKHAPKLLGE